jgi:hypothetical protein
MKFFLEIRSREENPASHSPKIVVGSGRSMRRRRWENGFLVMPHEVEGLNFMKRKIFRAALGMIKWSNQ